MMREELYCHHGLDQCHDDTMRDMSSCLGCFVTEPPAFIRNRAELERGLLWWGVPYILDTDTVYITDEDLPRGYYNEFLFYIWKLGFKREVRTSCQKVIE